MTRSIKALSGAAMLAALALPAIASAQDTTTTRTTRDSASGRTMGGMNAMVRFDTTQAMTLSGVTIVRLDSLGGAGRGAMTPSAQTVTAIVRSGSDSMQVVLAPSDYLASQQLMLAAGDVVSIKGVRIPAAATGAGASGAVSGSTTSSGSTGSTGTTIGASGATAAMTTVLATEVTKNGKTVALRDKSTGQPNWGTMGSDAAKNRGGMTPPGTTRDTSTKRDTSAAPSPVRKP